MGGWIVLEGVSKLLTRAVYKNARNERLHTPAVHFYLDDCSTDYDAKQYLNDAISVLGNECDQSWIYFCFVLFYYLLKPKR